MKDFPKNVRDALFVLLLVGIAISLLVGLYRGNQDAWDWLAVMIWPLLAMGVTKIGRPTAPSENPTVSRKGLPIPTYVKDVMFLRIPVALLGMLLFAATGAGFFFGIGLALMILLPEWAYRRLHKEDAELWKIAFYNTEDGLFAENKRSEFTIGLGGD